MPLNKPTRGDLNWDVSLNNALEYLDGKLGATGPAGPAGPPGPAASSNISGGSASSVYTINQSIDGGTAGSF
jgi:hypothetical protein